jgi:hypothetical protein
MLSLTIAMRLEVSRQFASAAVLAEDNMLLCWYLGLYPGNRTLALLDVFPVAAFEEIIGASESIALRNPALKRPCEKAFEGPIMMNKNARAIRERVEEGKELKKTSA